MRLWLCGLAAAICVTAIGGGPTPARGQNTVCPTRPPGDSTNACASTAFVTNAVHTNGRQGLTSTLTLNADNSLGVDSPSCGAGTGAAACHSLQQAATNAYVNYDTRQKAVVVQAATTGINYSPVTVVQQMTGGSQFTIQGDLTNNRSVIIDGGGTAASCVDNMNGPAVFVRYLKVQNCNTLLRSEYPMAQTFVDHVAFGPCFSNGIQMYTAHDGTFQAIGTYDIDSSTGCFNHIVASNKGSWSVAKGTVGGTVANIDTNLSYSFFISVNSEGAAIFEGFTLGDVPFNRNGHSVGGGSWTCGSNGLIQTLVADATFFPGSGGARILGDCSINQEAHNNPQISGFAGGTTLETGSDDFNGTIASGGTDTGGTITFSAAFDLVPVCQLTALGGNSLQLSINARSTTALGIAHLSGSQSFTWHCHGG